MKSPTQVERFINLILQEITQDKDRKGKEQKPRNKGHL